MQNEGGVAVAQNYYDSDEADNFYHTIWGGEDIHVGIYEKTRDIREASRTTVDRMVQLLGDLKGKTVLDIGAGYGGGARVLTSQYGAEHVTCLNIAVKENCRNRAMNEEAGLSERITVTDGSFDDIPYDDESFDVIWSQDAILHAPDRAAVMAEAVRVLKPGGHFIFTDPMQADDLENSDDLQPIYDRIHLANLASFGFYEQELTKRGLEKVDIEKRSMEIANHYGRVAEELKARRAEIDASDEWVERMLAGLALWVEGAKAGKLAWGIIHFRKPE
ncbi:methyltransferase domain-containing protein [Altericroceibacterium endophyticum]|uniref:Methyltransferase domain-containing protein n=1 Tax=Altericroceibacterium endophyticum TaxID=1808508 RepID=A0A6I4T2Y1_9SPHN|nr:methyltransferase domain-containing protein [Altericroceibacterium endophyticum]MXO64473.1 methyltransferase domain-containing protein [Altericroceibacterium endophyticum]